MDYVIVFLLGVAVTLVPAVLWAASKRRPAAAPAAQAQEHGPIIVLPRAPQPINNYTYTEIYNDNRRIEMPPTQQGATNGPPLVSAQQLAQGDGGAGDVALVAVIGKRG